MAVNQYGIASPQAQRAYKQEHAHLRLNCPKGKDGDPMYCPWPAHLKSSMLTSAAASISGTEFWEIIWVDEIIHAEHFDNEATIESRQQELALDKVETIDGGEVLFPPYCQEGVRCAVCGVRSERGQDEGCGIRGADCAVYGVWCAV